MFHGREQVDEHRKHLQLVLLELHIPRGMNYEGSNGVELANQVVTPALGGDAFVLNPSVHPLSYFELETEGKVAW